ncbi:DUF7269 family protein [Haladaptatus sp. NG-WS-4]
MRPPGGDSGTRLGAGRKSRAGRDAHPEEPVSVHPAGHDFDETLGSWQYRLPFAGHTRRQAVRECLHIAAIETVMRTENCSRDEARRLVESGSWTDDLAVSAYLGGSAAPSASVGTRAATILRGRTWHEHCAHRTAAEIAQRGEMA